MGSIVCLPLSRNNWARLDRMQDEDDGGSSFKDVLRLNLSSREVKLIQKIWYQLKDVNKGQVGIRFFQLVFEKCPEVKVSRIIFLFHLSYKA